MAQSRFKSVVSGLDTSTLNGSYQAINSAGFPGPCSILRIVNNSANAISLSYDGVNAGDFILANSEITLNFQASNSPSGHVSKFPALTKVSALSVTSSAGFIFVVCYYQVE